MANTGLTPKETAESDQSSSDANNGDARLIWIARLVPAAGFCLYIKYCRKHAELSTRILIATTKSAVIYTTLILGTLHQVGLFEPVYHTTSSGSVTTYDYPDNDISVVSQIVIRGTAQGEGEVSYRFMDTGAFEEYFEYSYEKVLSEEEIKEAAMNGYVDIYMSVAGYDGGSSCSIEVDGVEREKDTDEDNFRSLSYCSLKLNEPI